MSKSYELMESLIRNGNDLGVKKLMIDEDWSDDEYYKLKFKILDEWLDELDAQGKICSVDELFDEVEDDEY